jgi:hypothetical protein
MTNSRFRRVPFAFVAVAALVCVLPGSAPTVAKAKHHGSFFGINAALAAPGKDTDHMRRAGIGTARVLVDWAQAEPVRGTENWTLLDAAFAKYARRGIRLMPIVAGSPHWAVHKGGPPRSRPAQRAWGTFLRRFVERYGRDGAFWSTHRSLPRRPLHEVQLWNEPNFPAYWDGPVSATGYVRLLKAGAKGIRATHTGTKVVMAGLGPGLGNRAQTPCWRFLKKMYEAGAKRWFDVAADHPYAKNVHDMGEQVRRMARVMHLHHDPSPLVIDEYGWSSGHLRHVHFDVGPRRQAKILRSASKFLVRHRHEYNLERIMWYCWRDPPHGPRNPDGAFNFGLRHADGSAKRAWHAYLRLGH